MASQLRQIVLKANRAIATVPPLARLWVRLVAAISRTLPNAYLRTAIYNHMDSVRWPAMRLPPREIEPLPGVRFKIIPHSGEFDFQALFDRTMCHEPGVLAWLTGRRYRTIFEVGSNVGVYTLIFSRLVGGDGRVYAFEPSTEAFFRLLTNLQLNGIGNVVPLQCAIGSTSGLTRFYEPKDHLTNGSLLREFAASFSGMIAERTVLALAGSALQERVEGPLLIKIDAEGAEELVLRSMETLIVRHKPDIILEVLPEFVDALNAIPFLKTCGYRFFSLNAGGNEEHPHFIARWSDDRDYALVAGGV